MAGRSPALTDSSDGAVLCDLALELLNELDAEDVLRIEAQMLSYTDYVVLASGRSSRHQRTLAEKLQLKMKQQLGFTPVLEGDTGASWLVLDCGSLIVHLQTKDRREYYQLSSLWFESDENTSDSKEMMLHD